MVKTLPADAGDTGSVSRLGRSSRERNGNPFQHSCLESSMDREAWLATVSGVAKSRIHLIPCTQIGTCIHIPNQRWIQCLGSEADKVR